MAVIVFPSAPALNSVFTSGGKTWTCVAVSPHVVWDANGIVTDYGQAFLACDSQEAQRAEMGLGDAATCSSAAFATTAQGAKADTAVQPGSLGSASTQSNSAFILAGSLGTASTAPSSQFATAAQGALAATAAQKSSNLSDLTSASSARTNLGIGTAGTQANSAFIAAGSLGTASTAPSSQFATAAQGATADAALQPSGNGSGLTGITASQVGAATLVDIFIFS